MLSPFDRWDSGWFLGIVEHGYDTLEASAFSLYPATTWLVGQTVGSYEWVGEAVSIVSLLVALYLLHQLTALELGRRAADRTVLLLALYPLSFHLWAIYIRQTTRFGLLAPAKAHEHWGREFAGPLMGYWGGLKNAVLGMGDLLSGAPVTERVSVMRSELINGAALVFATVGVIGAIRRLPAAYWVYALAGLIATISFPTKDLQLPSRWWGRRPDWCCSRRCSRRATGSREHKRIGFGGTALPP